MMKYINIFKQDIYLISIMLPQDIFSTDFVCETPRYRNHEEIG